MKTGSENGDSVMTIVSAALRQAAGEREAYVRAACQGDEELLREVTEAMEWEQRTGSFLLEPLRADVARETGGDAAARMLGPYRLLEIIGEGGMAEVWLADQITPVHRRVALKLIKSGMDTKAMIARLESERQALALMDHPAIARVFDAGSTPQGRPYFVMEYVPGVPITEYCDKYRRTTRERLELFMQVCEGV
jgi:non-specific serine/threonine protein kinase/serine/threonine-protein kinase